MRSISRALVMMMAVAAAACGGGGDDGGGEPDVCEGISTCSAVGTSCSGDSIVTCAQDADGCLIETVDEDCSATSLVCDDSAGAPECVAEACTDDADCDGAAEGDSFCSGDSSVECTLGADGCLDATVVDCTTDGNICDDAAGTAECVASCEDHPLCVGAAEGDLACDGYLLNACADLDADGCLDFTQEHCGAALCDDAGAAPVCGVVAETGLTCGAEEIPVLASGFQLSGADFFTDFAGGIDLTDASCAATLAGSTGVALTIDLLAGETVVLNETGSLDSVLSVQSTCDVAGACVASEDLGTNEAAGVSHTAAADETVTLIVESFSDTSASSDYSIQVFIDPACGNGILELDETCDDANAVDGDGCSALCETEFGFTCDGLSPSTCTGLTSLGSYGPGEVIPPVTSAAAMLIGETDEFLITFSSTVLISGTLSAGGTGDFDLILFDELGDVAASSAVDGDETFTNAFVDAGTYRLVVENFAGGEDADMGYTLAANTGPAAVTLANGDTGAGTGTALDTDDTASHVFTFGEDVDLTGTLTGTGGSDFDLFIVGSEGLVSFAADDLDETYNISLQAGTYYFFIDAFDATAADYSLDFAVATTAIPDLGTFAAAATITDVVGGAIAQRAYDHYSITFSEDVLLTGLLDGNTTGILDLGFYDAGEQLFSSEDFTDELVPAGTYIIQIRTFSDALGGGDVDAYNLALSTTAP